LNLTVLNPGVVLGKYLMPDFTGSAKIIKNSFELPIYGDYSYAIISVEAVV